MAVESTGYPTEMRTNLPEGSRTDAPACNIDKLTAICECIFCGNGSLDVSHPYGPPCSIKWIAFIHHKMYVGYCPLLGVP
jgi:hypothetical protein